MPGPPNTLINDIYEKTGFFPTWLPGDVITLGMVGTRIGPKFRNIKILTKYGIPFDTEMGQGMPDMNYRSRFGVTVKGKAAGEKIRDSTIPVANAGLIISLGFDGSYIFNLRDCVQRNIQDREGLGRKILERYYKKDWNFDSMIIDSVVEAQKSLIVVSERMFTKAEIAVKGATPTIGQVTDWTVEVVSEICNAGVIYIRSNKPSTPLYSLMKIKDSWIERITNGPEIDYTQFHEDIFEKAKKYLEKPPKDKKRRI